MDLVAPTLLHYEVANSIWKNPNVSARKARSLVGLLLRLAPKLVEFRRDEAEQAMSFGRMRNLPYYDAAYISLAKSLSVPMVTADREQLDAARRYVDARHLSSIGEP